MTPEAHDEAARWILELDKLHMPTRYPNGLPSGARPSQVYTEAEAADAIARAAKIIDVAQSLP